MISPTGLSVLSLLRALFLLFVVENVCGVRYSVFAQPVNNDTTVQFNGTSVELSDQRLPTTITFPNGWKVNLAYADTRMQHQIKHQSLWTWLASQTNDAASSPTYARGRGADRFNVWPQVDGDIGDAEYSVVFDLVPYPGACQRKLIDIDTLQLVKRTFLTLNNFSPKPEVTFAGVLSQNGMVYYTFKLMEVPQLFAIAEKERDITAADLATLNLGRAIILEQTTPDDLILCLGNTGAFFYHTLNRPGDAPDLQRNAHLVPFSGQIIYHNPSQMQRLRSSIEFQTYPENVLEPIFATKSQSSKSRVVIVDYVQSGNSLRGFLYMLQTSGVWRGDISIINIILKDSSRPSRPVPGTTVLPHTIDMEDRDVFGGIVDGDIGRLLPLYIWYVWGIPWQSIPFPDQNAAAATIQVLRDGHMESIT